MPRKGAVNKRDVLPDPVYGSKLLTRFINKVMLDGKKGVAERIVYDAFDLVRSKTGKDPLEVFDEAMKLCKCPLMSIDLSDENINIFKDSKRLCIMRYDDFVYYNLATIKK